MFFMVLIYLSCGSFARDWRLFFGSGLEADLQLDPAAAEPAVEGVGPEPADGDGTVARVVRLSLLEGELLDPVGSLAEGRALDEGDLNRELRDVLHVVLHGPYLTSAAIGLHGTPHFFQKSVLTDRTWRVSPLRRAIRADAARASRLLAARTLVKLQRPLPWVEVVYQLMT